MRATLLIFLFLLFSWGQAQNVTLGEYAQVVPGDGLPEEVKVRNGNNNLDLIQYRDRYYFAFRTAPTHFASKKTKLYILSSSDLSNWDYETEFFVKADMREPRFLVLNDKLHFFFFEAGKHPLKFEPQRVWTTHFTPETGWAEKQELSDLSGFVPWRMRTRGDTAYMSAYYGFELYQSTSPAEMRLFKSTDGLHWTAVSEEPQVTIPSASEAEFVFDKEGNLWATVRLEGEGAVIVYADKDSLGIWHKHYTKLKYDSSFMFKHKEEIYLVSRRNEDGVMAKAPLWLPYGTRKVYNLTRYSLTQKRTALFRLDKQNMKWVHLTDFPSTGDTAFPAVLPTGENEFVLFNYTSNWEKTRKNWILGQLGKTLIYKQFFTLD